MARSDQCPGVATDCLGNGAHRARPAHPRGELAVGDGGAERNRIERFPDGVLQGGAAGGKRKLEPCPTPLEIVAYLELYPAKQETVSTVFTAGEVGQMPRAAEMQTAERLRVADRHHCPERRVKPQCAHSRSPPTGV